MYSGACAAILPGPPGNLALGRDIRLWDFAGSFPGAAIFAFRGLASRLALHASRGPCRGIPRGIYGGNSPENWPRARVNRGFRTTPINDLIKPAAIGLVTHESKADIAPESNGSIRVARIGHRYPPIQSGITPGAHGFD